MDYYINVIINYLEGKEYNYDECKRAILNISKFEGILPNSDKLYQLINNHTKLLMNDFFSFVNSLYYKRKIISINDKLIQANDDDINIIMPILYMPYYGECLSKKYNIQIDYLMYKYILKSNIFYSNENTFVRLSKYILLDSNLNNYDESIICYLGDNFYNNIINTIDDYCKLKKINVETFYNNYHLQTVHSRKNENFDINYNIGYAGEYFIFNLLKEKVQNLKTFYNVNCDIIWVSENINDSLNYDILIYNYDTGEAHAFEIKTTTKLEEFYNVSLSKREFNKFINGTKNRKGATEYRRISTYNVIRLFLYNNNLEKILILSNENDYFEYLKKYISDDKVAIEFNNDLTTIKKFRIDENSNLIYISQYDNVELNKNEVIEFFNNSINVILRKKKEYESHEDVTNMLDSKILKKILK